MKTEERTLEDIQKQEDLDEKRSRIMYLKDGVYEIDNPKDVLLNQDDDQSEWACEETVFEFLQRKCGKQYKKFYIGTAYETDWKIVLAKKPKVVKNMTEGSGFNYGSTNVIKPHNKTLLILAEND